MGYCRGTLKLCLAVLLIGNYMAEIIISNPPPGKIDLKCPQLIMNTDDRYNKSRKAFYLYSDRVPDFLAGEADRAEITSFVVRSSIKAKRAGKAKEAAIGIENAGALGNQEPPTKRVCYVMCTCPSVA